jgi:nucleotide-binding universal stress UspA family protein
MNGPLLVCYDGSEGARSALAAAAELVGRRDAVVACYWQPFAETTKRFGVELLELVQEAAAINEREEQLAQEIAEEGAELARAAGFNAEAQAVKIDGPIDEAILLHAESLDASAIVLGARKRSTLRSLLLGAIANEVTQRATRPVVLAPSENLADRRREGLIRDSPATVRGRSDA